jgi:hypothetical protein
MQNLRYILFVLAIVVGIALGLLYGLVISPVQLVDTTPETLRTDYKTDYVLMVAEAYSVEQDAYQAIFRLAKLGDVPPIELVNQALAFALEAGYPPEDLLLMHDLGQDMETWNPDLGVGNP